jgi:hypothetical protein
MSPMTISSVVFASVFGGALLGISVRSTLPEQHVSKDSQDVVKLGMGLVGTMAALVLGLLIATAQGSFSTRNSELTQMSANVVLLDRILAHYGPETITARDLLRRGVSLVLAQMRSEKGTTAEKLDPRLARAEGIYDLINELTPHDEVQKALRTQALATAVNIAQARRMLFEQSGTSIPMPFLIVLVFWLTIIFMSFGLFAPSNGTVIATFIVCALSVSGAIFLILELDRPLEGLIHISSAPLQMALDQLGR